MQGLRQNILLGVVIVMAIVGVRLNERDATKNAVKTAKTEVSRAVYEQDIDGWRQLYSSCLSSLRDRRINIRLLGIEARANLLVAQDKINTHSVHSARLNEANAQSELAQALRLRIPPRFHCLVAFPKPIAPAGVKSDARPLPKLKPAGPSLGQSSPGRSRKDGSAEPLTNQTSGGQ